MNLPTDDAMLFSYVLVYVLEGCANTVSKDPDRNINVLNKIPVFRHYEIEKLRTLRNRLVHDPDNYALIAEYVKEGYKLLSVVKTGCEYLGIAYDRDIWKPRYDAFMEFYSQYK